MKLSLKYEEVQLIYDCVKAETKRALESQLSEAKFLQLENLREKLSYRVDKK